MESESPPPRRYRQSARVEAARETGLQIVRAFGDLMRERWFDEITLEEVSERAGVNVRTVIRRFGGKEGLLEAFVEDFIPAVASDREAPPGDAAKAIERLVGVYEEWGDSVIRNLAQEPRHPALKRLLDQGRERHRALTEGTYASWLGTLDKGGRRRAIDALVVATDVYVWKLLRRDMGRSRNETVAVMRQQVSALLTRSSTNASKRKSKP